MTLAVLSAAVLSGCATKSFVTERVDDRAAEVDARIAALQRASDESETTIQRQAAQLREVDETANNAFALAMSAGAAADVAQTTADDVSARTDAIERASLRLVCEVVIADSHDQFTFADATLPDSARGTLDGFVEQLRQLPTASYLEIEGHTDATGPAPYNASRAGACGKRPTLPSRAAPAPAPQDERHQLRRRPAGGTQRRPRWAGEEPACRGPRTRMTADKVQSRSDELQRLVPSP
jgi:outer membrane protein OmpA-like peptidoglycan-associated protein